MGYRSEVAIAIAAEAVESFEAACPSILDEFGPGYDFNLSDGTPGGRCWDHKWIKWYESVLGPDDDYGYPGAWQWTEWLGGVDRSLYRFIRIGEDSDDSEDYGGFWACDMSMVRGIELPAKPVQLGEEEL